MLNKKNFSSDIDEVEKKLDAPILDEATEHVLAKTNQDGKKYKKEKKIKKIKRRELKKIKVYGNGKWNSNALKKLSKEQLLSLIIKNTEPTDEDDDRTQIVDDKDTEKTLILDLSQEIEDEEEEDDEEEDNEEEGDEEEDDEEEDDKYWFDILDNGEKKKRIKELKKEISEYDEPNQSRLVELKEELNYLKGKDVFNF